MTSRPPPAPSTSASVGRILYVQYTNPGVYPPLQHGTRILADAGWSVLMIGAGTHGADALALPPHANISVRLQRYHPPGWRQKLAYVWFVVRVLGWSLRWRPRWIYASDPFSAPATLPAAFLSGGQVVYHEHDSPPSGAAVGTGAFMQLILRARRRLARRATVCVLPNEDRATVFRRETTTRRPVLCLWNCPEKADALPVPAPEGQGMVLFYHGSIVPARLPETVIRALAVLPDGVRLRVAGYETIGHPGYVDSLRQLARQLGIGARFEYLGPIPLRTDLLRECRRADLGLAFMPPDAIDLNERAMTGASNKPFDYLACGLALLVSDLPDWRKMFVDSGFGMACDPRDAVSIASAVRWCMDHPRERREMGARGRARIQGDWNYETQFARLRPILEDRTYSGIDDEFVTPIP